MPLFVRMHEMTPDHAHEEIQLLAIDMSSMLFETMAPMPSWRDHYLARDQTPSYRYLRTVLQALTFLRGGDRWVLKSPQHLEQIPALLSVFPDATFVVTHRDPVAVTGSVLTMLGYSARMTTDHPDPRRDRPRTGRRGSSSCWAACLRDHELLPPERTVHVRLPELVADDLAVVRRIYAAAGQPFDERARASIAAYLRDHPQGRHGTVEVDWSVFGVDPEERRGGDEGLRRRLRRLISAASDVRRDSTRVSGRRGPGSRRARRRGRRRPRARRGCRCSTTLAPSRTTMRSAMRTVEKRCDTSTVIRPSSLRLP